MCCAAKERQKMLPNSFETQMPQHLSAPFGAQGSSQPLKTSLGIIQEGTDKNLVFCSSSETSPSSTENPTETSSTSISFSMDLWNSSPSPPLSILTCMGSGICTASAVVGAEGGGQPEVPKREHRVNLTNWAANRLNSSLYWMHECRDCSWAGAATTGGSALSNS